MLWRKLIHLSFINGLVKRCICTLDGIHTNNVILVFLAFWMSLKCTSQVSSCCFSIPQKESSCLGRPRGFGDWGAIGIFHAGNFLLSLTTLTILLYSPLTASANALFYPTNQTPKLCQEPMSCIMWIYGKSKYHQEEHMDCIICSAKVGFTLTSVMARLDKPTSSSFVSQAPAPWFWWWPSTEPLLLINILLVLGVQFHILSSGYLLKIFLHIIHKADLGLFAAVLRSLSVFFLGAPYPSPLQTLPTIPTTALGHSGSLGQHNLLFPL